MDSVGNKIKKERIKQGISLENIASITKIRVDVLKKIEDDDFKNLPPKLYVRGFLIAISDVLGLNGDDMVEAYFLMIGEKHIGKLKSKTNELKSDSKGQKKGVNLESSQTPSQTKPASINLDDSNTSGEMPKIDKNLVLFKSNMKKKWVIGSISALSIFIVGFLIFYLNGASKLKVAKNVKPQKQIIINEKVTDETKKIETVKAPQKEELSMKKVESVRESIKPDSSISKKNLEIEKNENKRESAQKVSSTNKYSLLKISARGRSWIKLELDGSEAKAMNFIVGMTRSFKVFEKAKLFLGNSSNLDIYFNDKKLGLNKLNSNNILNLTHLPSREKFDASNKTSQTKEAIKIDKDLISPPKLTPERLTL